MFLVHYLVCLSVYLSGAVVFWKLLMWVIVNSVRRKWDNSSTFTFSDHLQIAHFTCMVLQSF